MTETTPTRKPKTPPDPEFSAMRRILAILKPLPVPARRRVLEYAAQRIETDPPAPTRPPGFPLPPGGGPAAGTEPLFHQAAVAAGGLLG